MKKRVSLLKDRPDFEMTYTRNSILNITGLPGFEENSKEKHIDKSTLLIDLDRLYTGTIQNTNKETLELHDLLTTKYIELSYEDFPIYYDEILAYFKKDRKHKKLVLIGTPIYQYLLPRDIKGKLCIKGTSLIHSFWKTLCGEMRQKKEQYKNKEFKRKQYIEELYYVLKRKIKQIKSYRNLEKFYYAMEDTQTKISQKNN